MQRIYGWSEAEALARFQQLIRSEILKPYRSERPAKDGSLVKVWMTATTLVNKDGRSMPWRQRSGECRLQRPLRESSLSL